MSRRPLAILGLCLLVGGVVGYIVIGSLLYDTAIGLNASAYPVGAAFQHFAETLVGTLSNTVSGLVWVAVIVLLLFGLSFAWMGRRNDLVVVGDLAMSHHLSNKGYRVSRVVNSGKRSNDNPRNHDKRGAVQARRTKAAIEAGMAMKLHFFL